MRFLFFFVLMFSGVHSAFGDLIGGDVDQVDNFNGVVVLQIDNLRSCTGAKISPNLILTAAHCYTKKDNPSLGFSIVSNLNNNPTFNQLIYEDYYPYQSYVTAVNLKISMNENPNLTGMTNPDIAILKIKTPPPGHPWHNLKTLEVDYNFVGANQNLKVWGYGCEDFVDSNSNLKGRRKSGITTSLAEDAFRENQGLSTNYLTNMAKSIYLINIPTSGKQRSADGISICPGDSGGPVTLNGKIVGVNAYYTFIEYIDQKSGVQTYSGVSYLNLHTRVSYVKDWMEEIIKNSAVTAKPNSNFPNTNVSNNNGLFNSTCYSNWDKKNYFLCEGVNSICVSQGRWVNINEMESKVPDMIELCASKNPLIEKMYRSSVNVQPAKIDQNSCWSNFLGLVKVCSGESFICLGNNQWKNLHLLTPVEQNKCKSNSFVLGRFFPKK